MHDRGHFCSDECRTKAHNRRIARGRIILDAALIWRRYRNKGDFTKLCRILDAFLAEDRAENRARYLPPPVNLTAKRGRI